MTSAAATARSFYAIIAFISSNNEGQKGSGVVIANAEDYDAERQQERCLPRR
ncbi:hypothetical protein [Sphingomonas faeni]|uniref:hypothetical protein n=1 Tax=Sphingomonas faeni TaxID=185950 RepID=UPI003350163C